MLYIVKLRERERKRKTEIKEKFKQRNALTKMDILSNATNFTQKKSNSYKQNYSYDRETDEQNRMKIESMSV